MSGQSVLLRHPAPPRSMFTLLVDLRYSRKGSYKGPRRVFGFRGRIFYCPSTQGSKIILSSWLMVSNHHNQRPVALDTLKAYFETNLANKFIRPSKSPVGAPIFFDRRLDGSPRLCVQGFNNLTIKNRYRCLRLRRYPPSQSVKSDRRKKRRQLHHLL